jgi:hypothetical protein
MLIKDHEDNQEQVHSWLQTACIGWMRKTKNLEHIENNTIESPRNDESKQIGAVKFTKSPPKTTQTLQDLALEISSKQHQD